MGRPRRTTAIGLACHVLNCRALGLPRGDERGAAHAANRLGVAATHRPRGRPRKAKTALAGSNNAS